MNKFQAADEVVDCSGWPLSYSDEPSYPEGSREKVALRAPAAEPHGFLRAGHRYLFKQSDRRYPWQFWMEIFAYRFGSAIGVAVPPAHVAQRDGNVAALIEWFFDGPPSKTERRPVCTLGGELMLRRDPAYDREKGVDPEHCHNLDDVIAILEGYSVTDWRGDLTRMLALDALIGNDDRHHDNWGIVETWPAAGGQAVVRMTPAFDNGTSLAHERHETKLRGLLADPKWVERHAVGNKARHHLRLHRGDPKGAKYFDLLADWMRREPQALPILRSCAEFDDNDVSGILDDLRAFDVAVRLSTERAELIRRIVTVRRRLLQELIDAAG